MIRIVFLLLAGAFFGAMGVYQVLADPVAAPPLFFWSALLCWWAIALIKERRRMASVHRLRWP
jgi:hypothetical protein